jgi:hypothetical protein
MAQSIGKAFDDAVKTLKQLKWLKVETETGTNGAKNYTLILTSPSDTETEQNFSPHLNISSAYDMELIVSKEANPALIEENKRNITRQLLSDKRRGNNAQTTIVGNWTKDTDEGREEIIFTNTLTIRVLDRGDC